MTLPLIMAPCIHPVVKEHFAEEGSTVSVGAPLFAYEAGAEAPKKAESAKEGKSTFALVIPSTNKQYLFICLTPCPDVLRGAQESRTAIQAGGRS
jgi:pyruvate/2-oxoglutarate dehydrogenase complex dihydrolipoamide acyltransferase (E2) component